MGQQRIFCARTPPPKSRRRPKDSTLDKHLTNLKHFILDSSVLEDGQHWFLPNYNPLPTNNSSRAPNPTVWHQSKFWGYARHPKRQYNHLPRDHINKECRYPLNEGILMVRPLGCWVTPAQVSSRISKRSCEAGIFATYFQYYH